MSKLDELIQEYCPNGVVYKELQEVLKIKNGNDYKSFSKGDVPVYGSGGIMTYIDRYAYDKPSVLIPRKGSIDKLYYVDTPFWNVDTIFYTEINTEIVLPRYVFHCLLREHLEKLNTAGGVPSLTQKVLNQVRIPVPPLEVQREIVRILDNFTELTTELTTELMTELAVRKKQYEYYRDELLPFDRTDIAWKRMSDICLIARGASPRPIKNYITNNPEGVNWIKIGDVSPTAKYITTCAEKITQEGASKSRIVKPGDFILSNSMSFGRPYILQIEGCIHDGWLAISEFEKFVTADYLYYVLTSSYVQRIMKQKASFGGAVQNLNADIVRGIEIPIPSLEEQNRIVSVLDRFSIICTDLSSDLSVEIEARQKQYEYYRDKLLSFHPVL